MHAIPEDFRKHLRPGIQDASGFKNEQRGFQTKHHEIPMIPEQKTSLGVMVFA